MLDAYQRITRSTTALSPVITPGPRPDVVEKLGHFFVIDPTIIDTMCALGASSNVIAAYMVLARFSARNKDDPEGVHVNAGRRAVERHTGMSQDRARDAVSWLMTTINPESGLPFVTTHGTGVPRSRPHFRLQGLTADGTIALPNIVVGTGKSLETISDGTLSRIIDTARAARVDGVVIGAEVVRVAAIRLLIRMYQHLDVQAFAGVSPSVVTFGSVSCIEGYDHCNEITVELDDGPPDSIEGAARGVLRLVGAIRQHLAVMDEDGEVAYTLAVFGSKVDWMPEGFMALNAGREDLWNKASGEWEGPGSLTYRAPLHDGQYAELIACPTFLPLTAQIAAQKRSYQHRTALRLADDLA